MKHLKGERGTVYVGLSGGVDSAVSAVLLKRDGFNIVGVFIKVWSPEWLPCTWPEERRDAMRVCAALDIPFTTLDLKKEYKRDVAEYMIDEYRAGRTPNPDVMCNKEIKFGAFYNWAITQGADYVATGHYSQILLGGLLGGETAKLLMGKDANKDQSYFLWNLKHEQLPHILFPVGNLQKEKVRNIAKIFKIPVAEKKDSQGLCFLGKLDMKEFLKHYIEEKPGDVLDESGKVIGQHDGGFFYTIGESFSLGGLTTKSFIVSKNNEKNTLTVSKKRPDEFSKIKEVHLRQTNWISEEPDISKKYQARVRYRQELQRARLATRNSQIVAIFERPQILNPGQSIVLYDGEICLGGGVIA